MKIFVSTCRHVISRAYSIRCQLNTAQNTAHCQKYAYKWPFTYICAYKYTANILHSLRWRFCMLQCIGYLAPVQQHRNISYTGIVSSAYLYIHTWTYWHKCIHWLLLYEDVWVWGAFVCIHFQFLVHAFNNQRRICIYAHTQIHTYMHVCWRTIIISWNSPGRELHCKYHKWHIFVVTLPRLQLYERYMSDWEIFFGAIQLCGGKWQQQIVVFCLQAVTILLLWTSRDWSKL